MSGSEVRPMLWDTDQCAAALQLDAQVLRTWRKRGDGPPTVRLGGLVRYRPLDVQAWVDGLPLNHAGRSDAPADNAAAPITPVSTSSASVSEPQAAATSGSTSSGSTTSRAADLVGRRPARRMARGR